MDCRASLGGGLSTAQAGGQYQYPFQNPNLSMEERVTNIISLSTPEEKVAVLGANYYLILIPFQDETNNATLSSWQDHEEPMSSWSHPLGRLCSKPRTSGNYGKPWRCSSQRSQTPRWSRRRWC